MSNTRFASLLDASPLTTEEKYNLVVIFDALRDERQIDIIDNWSRYLAQIVQIQDLADAEKNRIIQNTFQKINSLIDDAYIRDQAAKAEKKKQEEENKANQEAADIYDRERQRKNIIEEQRSRELEHAEQMDPLAFL